MSPQAPVGLSRVTIVLALVMTAITLGVGRRLPHGALLTQAVVAAVANSVLVAAAHTRAGATVDAFAYVGLTAYVAIFFPRAAAAYATLVVSGFGIALIASGLPNMQLVWVVTSVTIVATGGLTGWVSRTLHRQANTDPLTGAANRGGLERATESHRRRRHAGSRAVTVAAWDLDDFKKVNDEHGHAAGDRLLTEAVEAWGSVLRRGDVLARVGGDEFVLVMPGTTPEEADRILERLRAAHPVSWSAGVVDWRPGEPLEACVARADRRLYEVKAARGRRGLRAA
jgi:diguanylate cyclase (GGDEF)-like protein